MSKEANVIKLSVEVDGINNKEIILRDATFRDMNVILDDISKSLDNKMVEFMLRVLSTLGDIPRATIDKIPANEMTSVFEQLKVFLDEKLPGLISGEKASS